MIEYRIVAYNDNVLRDIGSEDWQLVCINDNKMYFSRNVKPSGTEIVTVKEEYGKQEINVALEFLKKAVGITDFKEAAQWQRRYANHIVRIKNEIGDEEFKFRLKTILQDDFKSKNCNKLKYLYGELKSFIHSPVVETTHNKVSNVIF